MHPRETLMSKGLGRVQRKIAEILARDLDDAVRTDDICREIYGEDIQKKHRVAVIRAGKALAKKRPEIGWDGGSGNDALTFFHQGSVLSRAKARFKALRYNYFTPDIDEAFAPGGSWWHKQIIEGGLYWQRTEAWKKACLEPDT